MTLILNSKPFKRYFWWKLYHSNGIIKLNFNFSLAKSPQPFCYKNTYVCIHLNLSWYSKKECIRGYASIWFDYFLNFCRHYGFWQPLWIFINLYFVLQKSPIIFAFKSALSGIQLDSLMEVTCLYIPLKYFLKISL